MLQVDLVDDNQQDSLDSLTSEINQVTRELLGDTECLLTPQTLQTGRQLTAPPKPELVMRDRGKNSTKPCHVNSKQFNKKWWTDKFNNLATIVLWGFFGVLNECQCQYSKLKPSLHNTLDALYL